MPAPPDAAAAGRRPPGPAGHRLVGDLPELRDDPLAFLARCAREHGDVVRYRALRAQATLVVRPDLVDEALSIPVEDARKGRVLQALRPVIGNGLFLSEGEAWRRQRRMIQPAFSGASLRAHGATMGAVAERAVAGWRDGEARDIHGDLQQLTLAVAAHTLFSVDITSQAEALGDTIALFLERFAASTGSGMIVPAWVPTPGNLGLHRAVGRLDRVVAGIVRDRRQSGVTGDDLLGRMLGWRDERGVGLADEEVADQVKTLLVAGHATTDVALAWSVVLLATNPVALDRLCAEVDALVDAPLTAEHQVSLRYAEHVFRESLRLFPPAWAIPRVLVRDRVIDGYRLPAGSSVVASPWVTHRDPRYWRAAEQFDPDRWEDGAAGGAPRYAWFPFGGGPRGCVGQAFAMMEGTLILATMARRFRWTLAPGEPPRPWATVTLQPRGGVRVVLASRADGDVARGDAEAS